MKVYGHIAFIKSIAFADLEPRYRFVIHFVLEAYRNRSSLVFLAILCSLLATLVTNVTDLRFR